MKNWAILVIVLTVAIIGVLYFSFVPIETNPLGNSHVTCNNGKLILESGNSIDNFLGRTEMEFQALGENSLCALKAGDNPLIGSSVKTEIICINGVPSVVCKTRLYKALIMGKIIFPTTDKKIIESEIDYEKKCLDACPDGLDKSSDSVMEGKGYAIPSGDSKIICECINGDIYTIDLVNK